MSLTPGKPGLLPAFGMTSVVLGHIALLLFFLPILGVPVAAFGLLFGVVGLVLACCAPGTSLRWCLAGVAVCCLALAVNVAINYAPEGYLPGRRVPPPWQPVPDRPWVPPPASLSEEASP
jgi:hypothetical protein